MDADDDAGYVELDSDQEDDFIKFAGGVTKESKIEQLWGSEGQNFCEQGSNFMPSKEDFKNGMFSGFGGGLGSINENGSSLFDADGAKENLKIDWDAQEDSDDDDYEGEEEEEDEGTFDENDIDDDLLREIAALEAQRGSANAVANIAEYQLEKQLYENYEEDQIGQLDPNEVHGEKDLADIDDVLDEWLEEKAENKRFWKDNIALGDGDDKKGTSKRTESCDSNFSRTPDNNTSKGFGGSLDDDEGPNTDIKKSKENFATADSKVTAPDGKQVLLKKLQSKHTRDLTAMPKPTKNEILDIIETMSDEEDLPEDELLNKDIKFLQQSYGCLLEEKEEDKWDCETILTTKSNISNHPGQIDLKKARNKIMEQRKAKMAELKETSKTLPKICEGDEEEEKEEENQKSKKKPTAGPINDDSDNSDSEELDESLFAPVPELEMGARNKKETPEEKRARKKAIKEHKAACRRNKKETKQLFAKEARKIKGEKMVKTTGDVRAQGAKIFNL